MIRGLKTRTMRTDGLRMGYHPRLSDPARELVSRIQLLGSPRALQEMSDPELERWMQTCQAMLARPSRASSAHRTWRQLLYHASREHAARREQRGTDRGTR